MRDSKIQGATEDSFELLHLNNKNRTLISCSVLSSKLPVSFLVEKRGEPLGRGGRLTNWNAP